MRHIYEVSNEGSPGTKENWYEVYDESKECDNPNDIIRSAFNKPYLGEWPGTHVATFHTRDELDIYLHGLDRCRQLISKDDIDLLRRRHRTLPMGHTHYKYEIIPYESNE